MSLFDTLVKATKNEFAQAAEKGVIAGDVDRFIDTGSYSLNALISGSIFGGYPVGKVTGLAGDPASGKSFACLTACKTFLDSNPNAAVFYFESESAITKQMLLERNIDVKRFYIVPVVTVQEFKTQTVRVLDAYIESVGKGKERPPMLFVLDSLGMLSTTKEVEDTAAGSETKDMTRNQLIKAAFRILTLKLGMAQVPMIVTTHTYASMDQYSPKGVSGGSGLHFACSTIVMLNKRKEKDGTDIVGNNIRAQATKSRFTKEYSQVEALITYKGGLSRYHGLLDIAEKTKIFEKEGNRFVVNGKKIFGTVINRNPEEYFTEEVLKEIDVRCKNLFGYGSESEEALPEIESEEEAALEE